MIAVAHPNLFVPVVKPAVQQIERTIWRDIGTSKLGCAAATRLAGCADAYTRITKTNEGSPEFLIAVGRRGLAAFGEALGYRGARVRAQ